MNLQKLKFTRSIFLFVATISLAGCGGGGGSSSTPAPGLNSVAATSSASSQVNTSSSLSSLSSAPSSTNSSLASSSSSTALIAGAVIVDKAPDVQVKVDSAVLNPNVIKADTTLVKKLSNGVFIGEFNAPRSQAWAAGQIIMQDQQAYKVLAVLIDDDGSWLLQTQAAEIADVYKDLKFSVVGHGVGYDADGKTSPASNPSLQQKIRFQKTYNEQSMFEKYPCLKPTATIELPLDFSVANTDSTDSEYGYYLAANCTLKELASAFPLTDTAKSILNKITIAGKLGYTSRTKLYFDSVHGDNYVEQSATYGASEFAIKFNDGVPITQKEKEALANEDRRCKSSKGDIECEYALDFQSVQIPGTPVPVYIDTGMKFVITFSLTGSITIKTFSIKTTKLSGYKNKILQDDKTNISDKAFDIEKLTAVGSLDFYVAVTGGAAIGYSIGTAKAALSYLSLSIGPYVTFRGEVDLSGSLCAKGEVGARAEIDVSLFKTWFSDGYQILDLTNGYPIKSISTNNCDSNESIHINYEIAGKKYYNYNNSASIDGLDVFDASYAWIENTKTTDGTKQIIIDLSKTKGIDGNPLNIEVFSPITSKNIFSKIIKNTDGTYKAIINTGDITYGDTLSFVIKAFDPTNRAKTEVTRNVEIRFEKYFSAAPKLSDEIDKDGNPIWFVTHNIVGDASKITEDCISFASALDYCSIFSMFDPQYTWFLQRGNVEATKPKQLKFVTKAIEKESKNYLHSFNIEQEVTPKYTSISVSPSQVKVGDTLTLKITGLGLRGALPVVMPNCLALVEMLSEGNIKNNNVSTMVRTFTCKATKAGESLFAEVPSALIMSNIFSVTAATGNSSSSSSSSSAASNTLIPEFVPIPGKNFSMSKYETTFAQYDAYAEETGVAKPSDEGWGRGSRPVINVSWNDAVAYATWLSKKTGKSYRLPTEEEWEFSARAGTTTNYSWGNELGINNANCFGCGSQWDGKRQTAPVGSFAANGFSLFDVHGNVWEWTSGCLNGNCNFRVLRGGSWFDGSGNLRLTDLNAYVPFVRNNIVGFRLVQDTSGINPNNESSSSSKSFSSSSSSIAPNTVVPEFVPIPGKNFSMSKYETTFAQYDAYAEETGAAKPSDNGWGRGNRPVINVSWNDAVAYAAWLSKKTSKSYRLPSKEEWEFSAKAGTTTRYPWGDSASHEYANYGADTCCTELAEGKDVWIYTAPAGMFPANSFHLYDMHGNVSEWTEDCYGDNCEGRIVMGGAFGSNPAQLVSNYFGYLIVSWGGNSGVGFRLIQETSTATPEFVPVPGKNFSMSKYETTFAQYDVYAEETGVAKPYDKGWGRGNKPVINVNWDDAVAYAAWLSKKTGKNYRLPTEEEWEFAARAGTKTNYFWGDDIGVNNANCNGCGSQWDNTQTAPIGSFKPNGFGLFDMHGNVFEWTSSCSRVGCHAHVLRGGSVYNNPNELRSAYIETYDSFYRFNYFGFRLVEDTAGVSLNIEPTNTVTVFSKLKLWATNAWEGITKVVWSFSDGLADLSASVTNGISDAVDAIFTSTGEKTITATFKDSANVTIAQRSASITVLAVSSTPSNLSTSSSSSSSSVSSRFSSTSNSSTSSKSSSSSTSSSSSESNPLIGSWYFSDTAKPYPQQNHMLITFIDSTHYTVVMDVEDGSFNCKDGAEYGTYTWNSVTGELTAKSIIDNNDECGVDSPVAKTYTLANANSELDIQENGGDKITLKKVVTDTGIKGSWAMQRGSDIYVFTIIDGSHYIGSWPTDSEHDVEYGTYTYNATTGEFIGNTLNYISAESHTTLLIKNNQLERTFGNEKDIWQRLPLVITKQVPSEYIGTFSVTSGETYPLRVTLRQKNGFWALGEYDFHKLDGTMTPCEHTNANDATCHGAHSTFVKTADNSVISNNNGVSVFAFSTEIDQYGYTFTGTFSTPSLIWSGTWTKVATVNSSYTASGTFSVKVVQIPFYPVAPIYGKAFSMGVIETTFDQYDAYANATGAPKPDDAGWGRGRRPVINVSFNDAVAYAAWLSEKTGNKYRLPTEEEWEFAAKAGTTTTYSWGDAMGTNRCNGCAGNEWKGQKTAPTASYNPNGFGLYDMEGNVMEWTQSCFNQIDCSARSVRGGSFDIWPPAEGLIAVRFAAATTFRVNSLGFRLVQESDSIFEPRPAVTPEFVPIAGKTFSVSKYKTSAAEYFAYSAETGAKSVFGAGLGGGVNSVVVSWNDAVAYAAWISQKTGKTYRLPTGEELAFLAANNFGLNDLRTPTWEWTSSCPNDYCTGSGLNKNDPDDVTGFHLVREN